MAAAATASIGVDLATIQEAAANVEPYLSVDGTKVWSLMQLERQLRPEVYGRRRGGYLDRRRTPVSRSMVAMSSGGPPKEKAALTLAFPWPWTGTQESRGNETR